MDEIEVAVILDRIWETCVAPFADEDGVVPVAREVAHAQIEAALRLIAAAPEDSP